MHESTARAAEQPPAIAVSLGLLFCIAAADQSAVPLLVPVIALEFDATHLFAWPMAAYLLAAAAALAVLAWFVPAAGHARVLACGAVLSFVGGMGCALSGLGAVEMVAPIQQLIVARALQGAGTGAILAATAHALSRVGSANEQRRIAVVLAISSAGAFLGGPIFSGLLVEHAAVTFAGQTIAGWRWLFLAQAFFALLGGAGASRWRGGRTAGAAPRAPLRVGDVALLSSSFLFAAVLPVALLLASLLVQAAHGGSARAVAFALSAAVCGVTAGALTGRWLAGRTHQHHALCVIGGLVLFAGLLALASLPRERIDHELLWRLLLLGTGAGALHTVLAARLQQLYRPLVPSARLVRHLGAALGVIAMSSVLMHNVLRQLPREVPLLPGGERHAGDLVRAHHEAVDAAAIRSRVRRVLAERYATLERAYAEEPQASAEILGDARLPEEMKAGLRDGGLRARIHAELADHAATMEAELLAGAAGRDRLLDAAFLSRALKQQLANIPSRVFRDPELLRGVALLFRNTVLAQEDQLVKFAAAQSLRAIHAAMRVYESEYVDRIQRGTRRAFAIAIVRTFEFSLWIAAFGLAALLVSGRDTALGRQAAPP